MILASYPFPWPVLGFLGAFAACVVASIFYKKWKSSKPAPELPKERTPTDTAAK